VFVIAGFVSDLAAGVFDFFLAREEDEDVARVFAEVDLFVYIYLCVCVYVSNEEYKCM
jgi:hypothetical protein